MPSRKMRVEVSDEDGNRYTVAFEGKLNREKALRLFDIIELLGGVHAEQRIQDNLINISKFGKTKLVVEKNFPFVWFSSKEALKAYEHEFNENISLSTISTYLARMTDRGFLLRNGASHNRKYRVITGLVHDAVKIKKIHR
jgi:hypothetical protein